MARTLRMLGILALAAGAVLMLLVEAGTIQGDWVDPATVMLFRAGAAVLAIGIVLALLAPLGRVLVSSRCVRCGCAIEKGQTYCHDHLKTAVQEFQDKHRAGI